MEQAAGAVAARGRGPVVSALAVGVTGWLALVLVGVAIGALLTHVGVFGGLRHWDDGVNRWLVARRSDGWTSASGALSKSAETVPIIVGALLLEAVLALLRRWRDLLVVVIGLTIELATFLAINQIVRRPRPTVAKLGTEPSTFSFPSGHTAATVVLWGAAVLLLVPMTAPSAVRAVRWFLVAALAVAVGWARVYRGMHHVTDVTVGALVGASALWLAVVATRVTVLADGRLRERSVDPTRVETR
ncbi:phosphatase PAP2 family protein [Aquihabitans sp. McL0605]|uniref:phosphatase PAP2 family protein n=1 Tax=Aquihabitans sp. McL0605 TaxID=3415671 RepID=UPI003CE7AE82